MLIPQRTYVAMCKPVDLCVKTVAHKGSAIVRVQNHPRPHRRLFLKHSFLLITTIRSKKYFVMKVLFTTLMGAVLAVNPVRKVIVLLQDMVNQVELERTQDEELVEKFQCWYDKTKTEYENMDGDTKRMIEELSNSIGKTIHFYIFLSDEVSNFSTESQKHF